MARNPFMEFIEHERAERGRTLTYWAERWTAEKRKLDPSWRGTIHPATVARWAKGDRRIGPNNRFIFKDLPFDMDEYYAQVPPSDQTQTRSDVRRFGRTRAAARAGASTKTVVLAPDVAEVFRTTKAVNDALRTLMRLQATGVVKQS